MKVFRFIMVCVLALAVVAGIVLSVIHLPKRPCSGYDFQVNYEGQYPVISEEGIAQAIQDKGIKTIGTAMKDVNLEAIAELLRQNPYIESVNQVRFSGTKLKIDITLKQILLHVYAQDGQQYFVDEQGFLLPYSGDVTENVMVANGKINERYVKGKNISKAKGNLNRVYQIATSINENDFCRAQFRQFYVDASDEVILVPTVGRHVVLFGTEKNSEEKLFNLQQTYENGLAYLDMDAYSALDVRFKNRVIAKRK